MVVNIQEVREEVAHRYGNILNPYVLKCGSNAKTSLSPKPRTISKLMQSTRLSLLLEAASNAATPIA
jgi:hypothetical protein